MKINGWTGRGMLAFGGAAVLALAGTLPAAAGAQQRTSAPTSVVFDGVTVVDVEQGKLVTDQRVVIAGTRIQTMGDAKTVVIPRGAKVVRAQGKYLIPGLWDFHYHPSSDIAYPVLIATGVTGFRDASSLVPLDTMRQWRREILAGTRVGPPRQIFSGAAIDEGFGACQMTWAAHVCVPKGDTVAMRRLVDSLQVAGVDMLKLYGMSKRAWYFFAREARRRGLRFGGHPIGIPVEMDDLDSLPLGDTVAMQRLKGFMENDARTAQSDIQFADSGASIMDHVLGPRACLQPDGFEACRKAAERFQRTGLWVVPSAYTQPGLQGPNARAIAERYRWWGIQAAWSGKLPPWLRDSLHLALTLTDSLGPSAIAERAGMPILAGADISDFPMEVITGFSSHVELAMAVADGMTPLHALQTATLNAAKFLHADSLGTVAQGKLADLVLLDANPLADITNTLAIRAVVANGRYYDRATLDRFLTEYLKKRKQGFRAWRYERATMGAKRDIITSDSSVWR